MEINKCCVSPQAEHYGGLSKPSVAAAPLEWKKGNTKHLLVSTSALHKVSFSFKYFFHKRGKLTI